MKLIPALLTLTLVSCATQKSAQESHTFPFAKELLVKIQSSNSGARTPASVSMELEEGKSPRRIYFTSLYEQYLTLSSDKSIGVCPAFHHDKIAADSKRRSLIRPVLKTQDDHSKAYFPEASLGRKGFQKYVSSVRTEIENLCETGFSDNFYKYDNLVTHYSGKRDFHRNPKAMESVLKIPVFANYYLIHMMAQDHATAEVSGGGKEFITLTNAYWFQDYVHSASEVRLNMLRNKVVRR